MIVLPVHTRSLSGAVQLGSQDIMADGMACSADLTMPIEQATRRGVQCIRNLEWSSNPLVNLTYGTLPLDFGYFWQASVQRGKMQFSALGDIAWMNVKQCMCELCRSRGASEADRPHLHITPWHLWPTVYSPKVCPYYRHRWHCMSNSCDRGRKMIAAAFI